MRGMLRVCVLTISDRCSQGVTEDLSGKTLKDLIAGDGQLSLSRYAIVSDDQTRIQVSETPVYSSAHLSHSKR